MKHSSCVAVCQRELLLFRVPKVSGFWLDMTVVASVSFLSVWSRRVLPHA